METDSASWSEEPWKLVFFLKDFWLNILANALFDLGITRLDLASLFFLARFSERFLTRLSKLRLEVGYLETDLVIPWSLDNEIEVIQIIK